MNPIMKRFCSALEAAADDLGPKNLHESKGVGLSPWATWTLATLARRFSQERWARRVAVEQLHVEMPVRDEAGRLTGWNDRITGNVLTLPGWDFTLEGFVFTLKNRDSGARIVCNLGESYSRRVEPSSLSNDLSAMAKPSFPESRFKALHPHGISLEPSLDELVEHELLVGEKGTYYLYEDLERLATALDRLDTAWHDDEGRKRVASAVGDFIYLSELEDVESADLRDAAARQRSLRGRRLLEDFRSADDLQVPGLLLAMRQIEAPELEESVRDIFNGHLHEPEEHRYGLEVALALAAQLKKPALMKEVCDVFVRLTHLEQTSSLAWYRAAIALVKDPHFRERVFEIIKRPDLNVDTAVLALRYFPEEARKILSKMIRSDDRTMQEQAAAMLSRVGDEWARRELIAVLNESHDRLNAAAIRAVMRRSSDSLLHAEIKHLNDDHLEETAEGDERDTTLQPTAFDDAVAAGYERLRLATIPA